MDTKADLNAMQAFRMFLTWLEYPAYSQALQFVVVHLVEQAVVGVVVSTQQRLEDCVVLQLMQLVAVGQGSAVELMEDRRLLAHAGKPMLASEVASRRL